MDSKREEGLLRQVLNTIEEKESLQMNRRSFLSQILQASVGAAFLPSAVTYARTWKKPVKDYLWRPEEYGSMSLLFISYDDQPPVLKMPIIGSIWVNNQTMNMLVFDGQKWVPPTYDRTLPHSPLIHPGTRQPYPRNWPSHDNRNLPPL